MKDWCDNYHCPGDCGKRGHGAQHLGTYRHKKLVLAAWDQMESDQQRKVRELRAEIERKAKDQL